MIKIAPVITDKQRRQFVKFPLRLYRGNSNYAPCFYADELKLLKDSSNIYTDYCKSMFFLCYDGKRVTGRIGVMVNYAYNAKNNKKNARFTRLDAIDDRAVFGALLNAAEEWARNEGMDIIHGPLGYNDLDKEGMLIKGYEYEETYGGTYNYEYYNSHLAALGYTKEIDWLERRLFAPAVVDPRYIKVADLVSKKYGVRELVGDKVKTGEILDKYSDAIFHLIDVAYADLHGVVPLTEKAKQSLLSSLKLIINPKYLSIVADNKGEPIAFGLALPAMWHALNKSRGKMFPFGIFYFLPVIFCQPKALELALIAVKPEWQNSGVNTLIITKLWRSIINGDIEYLESNANLETNYPINNFLDNFPHVMHKARRCYIKKL